jgi:nucleotide-binding universal stress UspA family protein
LKNYPAIDDSQLSNANLPKSLDVAKIHQAELMLFRCIPTEDLEVIASVPYELGLAVEEIDYNYREQQNRIDELTKESLEKLKAECEAATNHSISIEYQYTIGEPGHCICEMAQEWQASLIIVGRRGHSGLVEAFVGSVSNYVVHHAPCDVLVIQPTKT